MGLFFIALAVAYLLGNGYIYFRSWEVLHLVPTAVRWALSLLYWAGACSLFFVFGNREMPVGAMSHALYYLSTGWLVFTLYLVMLLLGTDLLRLFHIQFPYRFIICLGLTIVILVGGYIHYSNPKTDVVRLDINKPVAEGEELRVVAVSDIHLGYGTTKSRLQRYVQLIMAQQPDLILISGDLIDSNLFPVKAQAMGEELRRLHAPLGIYMVPGNHEYHSGIRRCREFVQQETPICWLQDSTVVLANGLQIVGRDDRSNPHRKPLADLVRPLDPQRPLIVLDHQPMHLEEAVEVRADLQFSGHTHDGQVWPLNYITRSLFEVSQGYKRLGETHVYVSSGLSLWGPPFRIGTCSELTLFNIHFKP